MLRSLQITLLRDVHSPLHLYKKQTSKNFSRRKENIVSIWQVKYKRVCANNTWKITLEVPQWCSEIAQIQRCAKGCFSDLFWTVETTNPELKTGLGDTAVPSWKMLFYLYSFVQLRYTPAWALKVEILKCPFFIYNPI